MERQILLEISKKAMINLDEKDIIKYSEQLQNFEDIRKKIYKEMEKYI